MRGRALRMFAIGIPAIAGFLASGAASAGADPPTRSPVDLPAEFTFQDAKGNDPCGFAVTLDVLSNRLVTTTFVRQGGATSMHTAGTLKVRLTNATSPALSLQANISGPTEVRTDGSVIQIALGRQLWAFEPDVAPGLPRMALISGRTVSTFDADGNFHLISVTGTVQDVCASLTPG